MLGARTSSSAVSAKREKCESAEAPLGAECLWIAVSSLRSGISTPLLKELYLFFWLGSYKHLAPEGAMTA